LSGGEHHHGHSHRHAHEGHDHDQAHRISTPFGVVVLEVFEDGVPPRFRLSFEDGSGRWGLPRLRLCVPTERGRSLPWHPEPHAFTAHVRMSQQDYPVIFPFMAQAR
jgi:hypothetical protein